MSSSAGITGSVIGILGTFILLYDEIASRFVNFVNYIGYSGPFYLDVNPTTVTTTTGKLTVFPKLYFDLMNALFPYLRQLASTGNASSIITLFSEYLLYLCLPFIVGGALSAILTGGAAKSISSGLMGVLTSFILLESLNISVTANLNISPDNIVIDLLGIVVIGSICVSIVAGVLGFITGRIYGSGEEE